MMHAASKFLIQATAQGYTCLVDLQHCVLKTPCGDYHVYSLILWKPIKWCLLQSIFNYSRYQYCYKQK